MTLGVILGTVKSIPASGGGMRVSGLSDRSSGELGGRAYDFVGEPLVEMRNVSKAFGGVHALQNVDLSLYSGQVVGLLGENGAGKSTLVKVLTGVIRPDEGRIFMEGQELRFSNPRGARELGLAATYQEPMVFPDLDIAENIFAGRLPKGHTGVDWDTVYLSAQAILEELGVTLDPRTPVYRLGVADRQLIEIAKALSYKVRVLILDEPTSVLSSREIERLFKIVRSLRDRGMAILFISHKLDEVKDLTDGVIVMRDGCRVAERITSEVSIQELIRLMVGREIKDLFPDRPSNSGPVVLEVKGLTRQGYFEDISFTVRSGEILGFAGLVGAGRTEVAQALFGVDPIEKGEVYLNGLRFIPQSPRHAIKCGVAYLPENRLTHGLVLTMKVPLNITMPVWGQFSGLLGYFRRREMRRRSDDLARRVELQAGRMEQLVSTLSGGNQQKVVLGKWLAADPRVLILDEPTHGVDVGTKKELLRIVTELAENGVAIILISSELEEVRAMSTRLLVMREGRMVAEFSCPVESSVIMEAASGAVSEVGP